MVRRALSLCLLIAATCLSCVAAQDLSTFPATPLASLHFPTPSDAPEQADPGNLARGNQTGYNRCNSTTENQQSLCQTSFVNDLTDFCLWAPQTPNSTISDTEGDEVAWCTKKGHGTRLMPAGTLQGVQLLRAPDYVMITGLLDQSLVNIQTDDPGGELDPHGQDLRGNPIGGLMYSTAFTGSANQVIEWVNFMGSNLFCIKICNPAGANPAGFCQHTLDRIGCAYNAPSKYTVEPTSGPGEFEACDSDDMDIPGVYTQNGQTLSYSQPDETLGPITTVPYQPRVPASSNCVTTASAALFTDLTSVGGSASQTASTSGSASGGSDNSPAGSTSQTAAGAGQTGNAAVGLEVGAGVLGVAFAMAFLA
ncbi:hypothetical protein OF83DRAFT_1083534 [Amylostereum chailletii]|nr:hypothetical protein OF83DRAFT_1083534 [Amylostereum chailletii]